LNLAEASGKPRGFEFGLEHDHARPTPKGPYPTR
jgi:hypothetical protein